MQVVVDLIETCFGKSREQATRLMLHCHARGQAICGTYDERAAAVAAVEQAKEFARRCNAPAFQVRIEPAQA